MASTMRIFFQLKKVTYNSYNKEVTVPFSEIPETEYWNDKDMYFRQSIHKCRKCGQYYFVSGSKERKLSLHIRPDHVTYKQCATCFGTWCNLEDEHKVSIRGKKSLGCSQGISLNGMFMETVLKREMEIELGQYKLDHKRG